MKYSTTSRKHKNICLNHLLRYTCEHLGLIEHSITFVSLSPGRLCRGTHLHNQPGPRLRMYSCIFHHFDSAHWEPCVLYTTYTGFCDPYEVAEVTSLVTIVRKPTGSDL